MFQSKGTLKTFMDYLSPLKTDLEWSIQTIIFNVVELAKSLASCSFVWVRRCCNSAEHVAAKFALSSFLSFLFFKDYLPPAILAVFKEESKLCSSFIFQQ